MDSRSHGYILKNNSYSDDIRLLLLTYVNEDNVALMPVSVIREHSTNDSDDNEGIPRPSANANS